MGWISDISQKFKGKPNPKVLAQTLLEQVQEQGQPFLQSTLFQGIEIVGDMIKVRIKGERSPQMAHLAQKVTKALEPMLGYTTKIELLTPASQEVNGLSRVKNIIGIASGKGGVGKSTTSVSMAHALRDLGYKVGLCDADIYGPSLPFLTKAGNPTEMNGSLVVPPQVDNIKMISVPMFSASDKAQVLRGPMAGNLIKQFLTSCDWGDLDYLLIDYPPGTGDIQLSISQTCPLAGIVIVTTPQELALLDVRKAISMFETLKVPIIGVLETMSYFICDGCDKKHYIFSKDGGKKLSKEYGLPFLGQLPIVESPVGADLFMSSTQQFLTAMSELKSYSRDCLSSFKLTWQQEEPPQKH